MESYESLKHHLEALQQGETGITYDALVKFSEPLWRLYNLDQESTLKEAFHNPDALEVSVSILDSARLFWAFLQLDDEERMLHQHIIMTNLFGEVSDMEAFDDFYLMMATMEKHFFSMPPEECIEAQKASGYNTLNFQELLDYYCMTDSVDEETFFKEEENVNQVPDTIAYFAEPLLAIMDNIENSEALEKVMDKVQDYWTLAQAPEEARALLLTRIKRNYANSPAEEQYIEREALQMIQRYNDLFL